MRICIIFGLVRFRILVSRRSGRYWFVRKVQWSFVTARPQQIETQCGKYCES